MLVGHPVWYHLSPVVDQLGLSVDRVLCGSLMTSLEMAGVSLTLLKMESGWDKYIGKYRTISSNIYRAHNNGFIYLIIYGYKNLAICVFSTLV